MFEKLVQQQAASDPEGAAVRLGQSIVYSFGQMEQDIRRATGWLGGHNLSAGETVVIQIANGYHQWLLMFAAEALGIVTVPMVMQAPVTDVLVEDLGVSAVLSSKPASADSAARWIELSAGWEREMRALPDLPLPDRARAGTDPITVLLSSGTTGKAKPVLLDRAMVDRRLDNSAEFFGDTAPVGTLCLFPSATVGGVFGTLFTWLCGKALVLPTSPDDYLPLLAAGAIRSIYAAPTQLMAMLAVLPETFPHADDMAVVVGGGVLTRAMAETIAQRLTNDIRISYATTETWAISKAQVGPDTDLAGSAGPAFAGITIEIVDEGGVPLAPGELGIIRIRGAAVVDGYHGIAAAAANARYFRDGWYYPGDMGRLSADNVLAVEGRADDLINIGGRKFSPDLFESRAATLPGVKEAVVVALPMPTMLGRRLCVIYTGTGDITPDQLAAVAANAPDPIAIRIDEIPRNAMGKVDRASLRREVEQLIA